MFVPTANGQTSPTQSTQVWGATDVTISRGSPKYASPSGGHYLVFQPDGNLVVYDRSGGFVWGLNEATPRYAEAQTVQFVGGNLVVRNASGAVIWSAVSEAPDANARPELTAEGVLRLSSCRDSARTAVSWASNGRTGEIAQACTTPTVQTAQAQPGTAARAPVASQPNTPWGAASYRIGRGDMHPSPTGPHRLVFQPDGNLVIYDQGGGFVWGLNEVTPRYAEAQSVEVAGGDLVVKDARGGVIWRAVQGAKDPSARLSMTPAGVLQLTGSRGVSWSSDGKTSTVAQVPAASPTPALAPAPAAPPAQTAAAPAKATGFPIPPRSMLENNAEYRSESGNHKMTVYAGQEMALATSNGQPLWSLKDVTPNWRGTERYGLQEDGTFAAIGAGGKVLWTAPQTRKDPNSKVTITPFGALQVVASNGEVLWSSNGILAATIPTRFPIPAKTMIPASGKYTSASGGHVLEFMNGEPVIMSTSNGQQQWAMSKSVPAAKGAQRMGLQPDGAFVLIGSGDRVLWTAPQARKDPNSQVVLASDGALQVVASNGEILWANDGILTPAVNAMARPAGASDCAPEGGWAKCLKMATPQITIYGSGRVSDQTMNAAANVYNGMFASLQPQFPVSTFDGFKVYITNGEPFAEIKPLAPVGAMWPDVPGPRGGNFLRGGASTDFLWIEEQLICKDGVATRNADLRAAGMSQPDKQDRTFDQVVHEMAHSMEARYPAMKAMNDAPFARHPLTREEGFPFAVQEWFGTEQSIYDTYRPHMVKLFKARMKFSCDGYRP